MQYAVKIKNIFTGKESLYPVIFDVKPDKAELDKHKGSVYNPVSGKQSVTHEVTVINLKPE